jgi:GTP-binding protein
VHAASGSGPNFRPALRLLADLATAGDSVRVASGGRGGRGNGGTLEGDKPGSQRDVAEAGGAGGCEPLLLELKSVADVGLVGPPNAGKSTLLVRAGAPAPCVM